MREMLFRAWIISKNKYADDVMIRRNKNREIILVCYDDDYFGHIDRKNVVIVQFTGIEDKNGKKIFEGDRVKAGLPHAIYNVIFKDGCYYLVNSDWCILMRDCPRIEIIGNIHDQAEVEK